MHSVANLLKYNANKRVESDICLEEASIELLKLKKHNIQALLTNNKKMIARLPDGGTKLNKQLELIEVRYIFSCFFYVKEKQIVNVNVSFSDVF